MQIPDSVIAMRGPKMTAIVLFLAARSAWKSGTPEIVMAERMANNKGMLMSQGKASFPSPL
ncbi:unnamed protein product [marine sediment metagenome]|uniref:Uncharacterized protein n=1 Tax=marine sediment metagenome TaxID=412755 RepID=X0U207_9ZZZZ